MKPEKGGPHSAYFGHSNSGKLQNAQVEVYIAFPDIKELQQLPATCTYFYISTVIRCVNVCVRVSVCINMYVYSCIEVVKSMVLFTPQTKDYLPKS